MKKEKGFTLIELVVAMAILILVSVPIFKSFLVSTKVNVKSYEKDKANIAVTNKIEEIKGDPHVFIENHPDNTETRYYCSLFDGSYYHCMRDGKLDEEAFDEYTKSFFTIFPDASGCNASKEENKKTYEKRYKKNGAIYYDTVQFEKLKTNKSANLSRIKCIINKCSFKEYYDSNWVSTTESKAKYEAQIEVSRKSENHIVQTYNPETLFADGDRYDVPFVENYFALLTKGVDRGGDVDSYDFYIFYNYSSEDFKRDLKEVYHTTKPKGTYDLMYFLTALSNFQCGKLEKDFTEYEKKNYAGCYDAFRKHKKAYVKDIQPKQIMLEVEKDKTNIPVRIDFNNGSIQPMYNVEVYNMTDKPMELYVLHNETNNSEVKVKVSKGESKKTEVYTTKNFAKSVYKIDVKLIRKEDNHILINYRTEKFVPIEEAQDFNFIGK